MVVSSLKLARHLCSGHDPQWVGQNDQRLNGIEEIDLEILLVVLSRWLPTNEACTLVQASRDEMIKDVKEVIAAICKFDKSLHTLMDFNENPLPDLCAQVCHLACWMYAILGAAAFQTCSGEHEWHWIPLMDFPYFPILTIMMMFAWLRMGAICTSPFDGDGHFDLNMHQTGC